MSALGALRRLIAHYRDMVSVAWRAYWQEPAPIVDVQSRKQAIADAEFNHRADSASRAGRVSHQPTPQGKQGRLVKFVRSHDMMGYPGYSVRSVRGDFALGRLEFRNQWREYAYYGPKYDGAETPMNMEMLAEIYAMLRELRK